MLVTQIKNPTTNQFETPSRFKLPSSVVASVIEAYLAEHPITLSDAQKAEMVQSVVNALPSAEGSSF